MSTANGPHIAAVAKPVAEEKKLDTNKFKHKMVAENVVVDPVQVATLEDVQVVHHVLQPPIVQIKVLRVPYHSSFRIN